MKYRKKPVVIEAFLTRDLIQAAGSAWLNLPKCVSDAYESGDVVFAQDHMTIRTLEGVHRANIDDLVICGVKGELYPCKPDIFAATYEAAEDVVNVSVYFDFGAAVNMLKCGKSVARAGWNGKGMFVYLVPEDRYVAKTDAAKAYFGAEAWVPYNAYFAIKNVNDTVSTWVPSVNDALAEDWKVV